MTHLPPEKRWEEEKLVGDGKKKKEAWQYGFSNSLFMFLFYYEKITLANKIQEFLSAGADLLSCSIYFSWLLFSFKIASFREYITWLLSFMCHFNLGSFGFLFSLPQEISFSFPPNILLNIILFHLLVFLYWILRARLQFYSQNISVNSIRDRWQNLQCFSSDGLLLTVSTRRKQKVAKTFSHQLLEVRGNTGKSWKVFGNFLVEKLKDADRVLEIAHSWKEATGLL